MSESRTDYYMLAIFALGMAGFITIGAVVWMMA